MKREKSEAAHPLLPVHRNTCGKQAALRSTEDMPDPTGPDTPDTPDTSGPDASEGNTPDTSGPDPEVNDGSEKDLSAGGQVDLFSQF